MTDIQPVKDYKPKYTQCFINNEFVNSKSGKTFEDINPANKKVIALVQEGDKDDINAAVAAAKAAFDRRAPWRTMTATDRGKLMFKLADLIERDTAILATLETLDVGKPFTASVEDIIASVKFVRYAAGYADKIHGTTPPMDGPVFTYTRLEPVGVCGGILPWNYPLMILCWKLSPALAAGCTTVFKPAEQSPLSALHVGALIVEAGFPPGVVNIVPGYGPTAGSALSHHMDVDKISFTGSTVVGRLIMAASGASNLKKVTLELGGKSPNVIFADADLDTAVENAHFALFFNNAEDCCAGSRSYVQEEIYDEFVKKSKARALARTVGDPFDPKTESGPQIDEEQYNKILSMIEDGKKEGAKLECGGAKGDLNGYYIQPTVFSNVTDNMSIAREEIFGPVQQIIKFKDIEEVIDRANDTAYGLAAGIFTKDINKALKYANNVRAGQIWVNTYHITLPQAPFGGYKQSGIGREHGLDGILEYCEVKTVTIDQSQ